MDIKPIRTIEDFDKAAARIDELVGANVEEGTPEYDELDLLSDLVWAYEQEHWPVDPPSPIDAILVRMEDLGWTPKDLELFVGSEFEVIDILNRRKPLTLPMIQRLSKALTISLEVLAREYPLDQGVLTKENERITFQEAMM